jgi:hypothetical protein
VSRCAASLLAVLACACRPAAASSDDAPPPPTIVRIELPAESDERQPFTLPSETQNTLEIDFPWPVADWAGRGFTPDPERFAGDFVIEAARGGTRIFVTPVADQAHRVLHVVLAEPGGGTRSVPIEFVPAPAGLAWRKVVFGIRATSPPSGRKYTLSALAPASRLRDPSPESEISLVRTMRLLAAAGPEDAPGIAAANPALGLAVLDGPPRSFGDFTIACRLALRDATTDSLGLLVIVSNETARRLIFDPAGWVVRAGNRAYPVRTVDFSNEVEPGSAEAAFLVVARAPDGSPTLLLPDSALEVSAVLAGSANPRPVRRIAVEGFGMP